jgi:16S rRNA (cytidine1402-2'-O)-methyltransferase
VAAGLEVEVLPGPSSALAALVASGLPSERWRFVGFLPRKKGELARVLGATPETLVAFEAPQRLVAALQVLVDADPSRPVAVCRELTKLHEEVRRGTAESVLAHYRSVAPRGEVVLVVGAAPPGLGRGEEALAAVRALVEAGARPRAAATVVAGLTGTGANELYRGLTGS